MDYINIEKHIRTGFFFIGSLLLFAFYLTFNSNIWLYLGFIMFFIFFNNLIGWHHFLSVLSYIQKHTYIYTPRFLQYMEKNIIDFFSYIKEFISVLLSLFFDILKNLIIKILKYVLIVIILALILNYFK